jgi:hypothetical protein
VGVSIRPALVRRLIEDPNLSTKEITMGKLVVTEFITLDGVVEAPAAVRTSSRRVDLPDQSRPEGDAFKLNETRNSDALLFGRVTYEGMAAAWPHRTARLRGPVQQPAEVRREQHADRRVLEQHRSAAR